jgi:AraC-like DNA-binding protein
MLRLRLRRAKELLATSTKNITEIAREVGFEDSLYFSRLFHRREGISPTQFRKHHLTRRGQGSH